MFRLRVLVFHLLNHCRFVAFIAGSFAAVLGLASVLDPDLIVHFEITPHRTVLFYLTLFGSILAVARGMIPEENRVFDPELLMTEVIQYTHYMPDEWKDELHSKKASLYFLLLADQLLTEHPGTRAIRRTVRDEDRYIRSGTDFCAPDAFGVVVLATQMRTGDHRLLP